MPKDIDSKTTNADVLHIGFTGHRTLRNADLIAHAISEQLERLLLEHPQLVAISSFAEGADRLFVKVALKFGIPWIAISPLPLEEFFKDFDETSAIEAANVLTHAAEVQVIGENSDRPEAYLDAGLAIVDQSDLLLAAWDGCHSDRIGGTFNVIEYALLCGRTVLNVHGETGECSPIPAREKQLVNGKMPSREEFLQTHAKLVPLELMREFEKEDLLAGENAPRVRRLTLRMVLFEALSSLCALIALTILEDKHEDSALIFAFLKTFFVGWAVWIAWRLGRHKDKKTWADARVKSELCRSAICTWSVTGRTPQVKHLGAEEFKNYMRWLNYFRLKQGRKPEKLMGLEARKLHYRKYRIWGQLEGYYRKEAKKAEKMRRWLVPAHDWVSRLALLLGLCGFFYAAKIPATQWLQSYCLKGCGAKGTFIVLKVAPIALPALATWLVTWMSVTEVKRREWRYSAMVQQLELLDLEAAHCQTQASLECVVARTERFILNEIIEWYGNTIQEFKMSKPPRLASSTNLSVK